MRGVPSLHLVAALALAMVWSGRADSEAVTTFRDQEFLVALGRQLFFDKQLSADGKVACASCHQPEHAFQDGRGKAQGVFNRVGTRNTPSLLNVHREYAMFWDGRRPSLEAQALDPMLNVREQGLGTPSKLLAVMRSLPRYKVLLSGGVASAKATADVDTDLKHAQAMASDAMAPNAGAAADFAGLDAADQSALARVAQALAAFEATISDGPSAFDRYRYKGENDALSESQRRGWRLFSGRAGCLSCHQVGSDEPALFTDHDYHALPLRSSRINAKLASLVQRFMQERQAGKSVDEILLTDDDASELGRFAVTLEPADIGKFKTPTLRNVALTAPYMHDGSVATLSEAVDLEVYYRGNKDGHPLILTPGEKQDLVAFLQSLTGFVTGAEVGGKPSATSIDPPALESVQRTSRALK